MYDLEGMYSLEEPVYFDLEEIIDAVEESVFLENKESEDGYYKALGQLVLLKRLVDRLYGDGNHIREVEKTYEYIDHKMSHYFETFGFENFEDLEVE